jgi:hypothetical protein
LIAARDHDIFRASETPTTCEVVSTMDSTRARPQACIIAMFAAALLTGCAAGDAPRHLVSITDSAGVVITMNPTPALEHAAEWRVDSMPLLRIGVLDGDTVYQLNNVGGVRSLRSGNIAVLNFRDIRIFDRGGRFIRSISRDGEGPGELRTPTGLWRLPGDSLLVFDAELGRSTVFTETGRVARVTPMQAPILNAQLVGVFADGSLLMLDDRIDVPPAGFSMNYTTYVRRSADGVLVDSLPRQELGLLGLIGDPRSGMIGGPAFTTRRQPAAHGSTYWVPTGGPEILRYSAGGTLQHIYRWDAGDLSVLPDEIRQWREDRLRGVPAEHRPARERLLAELPAAERHAAVRRTLADEAGRLWAEVNPRPGHRGPSRWLVFDDDGVVIARVELPPRFTPHEIGRNYVLGVQRDALDIEYVVRYRLRT